MYIMDLFEAYDGHAIIIKHDTRETLLNTFASGDVPPDLITYEVKSIKAHENLLVIEVY